MRRAFPFTGRKKRARPLAVKYDLKVKMLVENAVIVSNARYMSPRLLPAVLTVANGINHRRYDGNQLAKAK